MIPENSSHGTKAIDSLVPIRAATAPRHHGSDTHGDALGKIQLTQEVQRWLFDCYFHFTSPSLPILHHLDKDHAKKIAKEQGDRCACKTKKEPVRPSQTQDRPGSLLIQAAC